MIVLGGGPVGSRARPSVGLAGDEGDVGRGRPPPARPAMSPSPAKKWRRRCAARFGVDVRIGEMVSRCAPAVPGRSPSCRRAARSRARRSLVAVGRKPHTDDLGLNAIGSSPTNTASLRSTTGCGSAATIALYAIGDVNGRGLFTPRRQVQQAWIVAENLLGREVGAGRRKPRLAPRHLTDPQVAAVGRRCEQQRRRASTPRGRGPHRRLARRQLPGQGHRRQCRGW